MNAAASALWASIIRTLTPIIVGAVIGWAVSLGITLDPEFEAALTITIAGAFQAVYYIAFRLFETYVSPKLGWFLGLAKTPAKYTEESPAKHKAYGDGEGLFQ